MKKETGILTLQLILMASNAMSADNPATIGPADCLVINPHPVPEETISWSGGCANGFAEGSGVLDWYNRGTLYQRFEGRLAAGKKEGAGSLITYQPVKSEMKSMFKDNQPHGRGVWVIETGQTVTGNFEKGQLIGDIEIKGPGAYLYRGAWLNGMPDGLGHIEYQDGAQYDGEFKFGLKQGQGTLKAPNGQVLTGIFEKDELIDDVQITGPGLYHYKGRLLNRAPHGRGSIVYADGTEYEGNFANGLRSGQGTMRTTNGTVIQGNYVNDQLSGQTHIAGPTGQQYDGMCEHDKLNGPGQMKYTDGAVYVGIFKDGVRQGKGKLSYLDGTSHDWEWKNDLLDGFVVSDFADGSHYEGEYKAGKLHGKGRSKNALGRKVEGNWKDGWLEGHAEIQDPDLSTYSGEFKNGKKHGFGVLTIAAGGRIEGVYEDDIPNGIFKMQYPDTTALSINMKKGVPHGRVDISYPGGAKAWGDMVNGMKEGVWTLSTPSGEVFSLSYHLNKVEQGEDKIELPAFPRSSI